MENDKSYSIMIGHEIERLMKIDGINQVQLVDMICKEFPLKDNGKERNKYTTKNNVSNILNGKSYHADTLNKIFAVMKAESFRILRKYNLD